VEVPRRDRGEPAHELEPLLRREVAGVHQASRLPADRLGHAGMAVPEARDHVAVREVEVPVAVGGDEGDPLTALEAHGEQVDQLEEAAVLEALDALEDLERAGAGERPADVGCQVRERIRPLDRRSPDLGSRLLDRHDVAPVCRYSANSNITPRFCSAVTAILPGASPGTGSTPRPARCRRACSTSRTPKMVDRTPSPSR